MNSINYFLLTEVKAKNISTAEIIANFCLTPARYLWNGKKIDFIQESGQKAAQVDFIYTSNESSWVKTAFMVVLLIPSTFLGMAFKGYATYRYHVLEDDVFLQNCLKRDAIGKLFTGKGQSAFGEKIRAFIDVLKSTYLWNPHFKHTNKPLFLSEITSMRLLYEENFPTSGGWTKQSMPQAVKINREILDNIHFLWNLSYINLADHYAVSEKRIEVSALKEINPTVISLETEQLKFTDELKAEKFFSN